MFSGKFLFTLVGIVLAILAICNFDFGGQPVVENWMGIPSMTVTGQPYTVAPNGATTAFSGNYFDPGSMNMRGSGKFVSVPSYQALLSPRFSNVQYGANIRYNMPDRENLAAPCAPLTFGDMAKENYVPTQRSAPAVPSATREDYSCGTGQCGASDGLSCGKGGYGMGHKVAGGYELPVGYTNGNYADVYNGLTYDGKPAPVVSQPCVENPTAASLPVGTMSTMDAFGNSEQFVVMNRLMNVQMSGRLRAQGDPIRGDLAITPCQAGWFSVYPRINTDLQQGAMNVLNGDGESTSKLMQLLVDSSGGARTTFGGTDMANNPNVNMTPQMKMNLSQASNAVQVTAFP
jgi:hypothetical protein